MQGRSEQGRYEKEGKRTGKRQLHCCSISVSHSTHALSLLLGISFIDSEESAEFEE
jgi:hypothetical protein